MRYMSACDFVGSNVDIYVPLYWKGADLFLEWLDDVQKKNPVDWIANNAIQSKTRKEMEIEKPRF